MQEAQHLLRIN